MTLVRPLLTEPKAPAVRPALAANSPIRLDGRRAVT